MKPKTVGRAHGENSVHTPMEDAGLMANSIILTLDGEKAVSDVRPGDRIITRDAGTAIVRNIRKRRIKADAIVIQAGSLGDTRPDRDMILPAGQGVLVRDWRAEAMFGARQALVPAERLIDGEFIRREGIANLTVIELEFDRPHILYVDGIEVAGQIVRSTQAKAA